MPHDDRPSARDAAVLRVLRGRDGLLSFVELADGRQLRVHNVAWGYDVGDEWAHITTTASPFVEGEPIDVFSTEDVVRIADPESGTVLISPRAGQGEPPTR